MKKKQVFIFTAVIILLIIIGGGTYITFKISSEKNRVAATETQSTVSGGLKENIADLDTSDKLVQFMNEGFVFEEKEGSVTLSPEQLFQTKKGGAQDFAVFAAYVLDSHKYEAGVLRYEFLSEEETKINTIVFFRDTDQPKYLYFDEKKVNVFSVGGTFEEVMQAEEKRLDIKITGYTVFPPGVLDLETSEGRRGR